MTARLEVDGHIHTSTMDISKQQSHCAMRQIRQVKQRQTDKESHQQDNHNKKRYRKKENDKE